LPFKDVKKLKGIECTNRPKFNPAGQQLKGMNEPVTGSFKPETNTTADAAVIDD
jgi:hypothetical protein